MAGDAYRWLAWWQDTVLERLNAPLRGIGLSMFPPEPGMRVLDIGCGTGAQLARYADAGCEVAGVDTSEAMLARARQRLGAVADLRRVDAVQLPFPDGSFDLVTATLLLHELRPEVREVVVKEVARVLTADGRLLVTDFAPGPVTATKGRLLRAFSVVAELLARHLDRSRAFVAEGGVPAYAVAHGFVVERTKVVAGGNLGVYLLRPAAGEAG